MVEKFPPPHERIAIKSINQSPLLLRLRSPRTHRQGHIWLRVHENGDLEQTAGTPRTDVTIKALYSLGPADRRTLNAAMLRDKLRASLSPMNLEERASPWGNFYPVQAFAGTNQRVVEGYIGVEIDMGVQTDIFGLDPRRTDARSVLTGLVELLALLPNR